MALYVYISESCREQAKKHSCHPELDKLIKRIESRQLVYGFHNFPPPFLVRKKFSQRQLRLIASRVEVEGQDVLYLHEILVRGDHAYNDFQRKTDHYFETHFDEEAVSTLVRKRIEQSKPPLPESPSGWPEKFLFEPHEKSGFESGFFICESGDWVETTSTHHDYLAMIHEKMSRQKWTLEGERIESIGAMNIVFRSFPSHRKVFFAGLVPESGIEELREKYADVLLQDQAKVTEKIILKNSLRSYTEYMFAADERDWANLQKERNANLALSPEEVQVLESAYSIQSGESNTGFPLFINGRAGSGKSTILQYIFSNYIFYYIKNYKNDGYNRELPEPPQFFSYSPLLIEHSRKMISSLIRNKERHDDNADRIDDRILHHLLNFSVRVFREFLFSMLPSKREIDIFSRDKYVNYSRFRKLWEERFKNVRNAREQYNVDISWHVIRTYIKGYDSSFEMTPDEYEEIPNKRQTVSLPVYRDIFKYVWENWYSQQDYWDDQDLSRYLLENDLIKPVYPAIFCDEAQDFTKVELDLVRRMSIYSKYRLDFNSIRALPIAFAGDQFQTLNPTGFRWDQTRAAFYESLIDNFDPHHRNKELDINFQELKYNYRSGKNIVNFTNSIQFFRMAAFNINKIQPQHFWGGSGNTLPPLYFNLDAEREQLKNALIRNEELTIIVPCLEGEEAEFVEADPFLKEFVTRRKMSAVYGEEIAHRIYSPERIKGLEEEQVVVYRFGEFAPKTLFKKSDKVHREELELQHEYFMNRVYVAVSRPQVKLFIIDTEDGRSMFWDNFSDSNNLLGIIREFSPDSAENQEWIEACGFFDESDVDALSESLVDPLESAEEKLQRGMAASDPYFLYQASISFANAALLDKHLNDKSMLQKKSHEARGRALHLEGMYKEAATYFTQSENYELAVESYWRLMNVEGWTGIIKCANLGHQHDRQIVTSMLEFSFANFMLKEKKTFDEYLRLLKNTSDQSVKYKTHFLEDQTWENILAILASDIVALEHPDETDWIRVLTYTEPIEDTGLRFVSPGTRGTLLYRSGKYKESLAWFEQHSIKNTEYWHCFIKMHTYPEVIQAWTALEKYDKVLGLYDQNNGQGKKISAADLGYVIQAALKLDRIKDAENLFEGYLSQAGKPDVMILLVKEMADSIRSDRRFAVKIGALLINRLVELNRERAAIALVFGGDWEDNQGKTHDFSTVGFQNYVDDLDSVLIRALRRHEKSIDPGIYELWTILTRLDPTEKTLELNSAALLFVRMCAVRDRLDILPGLCGGIQVNLADYPDKKKIMVGMEEVKKMSMESMSLLLRKAVLKSKQPTFKGISAGIRMCRHATRDLNDPDGSVAFFAVTFLFDLACARGYMGQVYDFLSGSPLESDDPRVQALSLFDAGIDESRIEKYKRCFAESAARFAGFFREQVDHPSYPDARNMLLTYAEDKALGLSLIHRSRLYEKLNTMMHEIQTYYEIRISDGKTLPEERNFYRVRLIVAFLRQFANHQKYKRERQAEKMMKKASAVMKEVPFDPSSYSEDDYPVPDISFDEYMLSLHQHSPAKESRSRNDQNQKQSFINKKPEDFTVGKYSVEFKLKKNRFSIENMETNDELLLEIGPLKIIMSDTEYEYDRKTEQCVIDEWGVVIMHYRKDNTLRLTFREDAQAFRIKL